MWLGLSFLGQAQQVNGLVHLAAVLVLATLHGDRSDRVLINPSTASARL
jgi:hypothetical protein